MDYAEVKSKWEKRGFSCGIWIDPPGQIWVDFVHDTDELVMLLEGEIEISFLGTTLHPKISEEILIPRGARHTVENIGKTSNRWYYGYKQS